MEIRFLMTAALCAGCGNDSESARAQDAARSVVSVRPAFTKLIWNWNKRRPNIAVFLLSSTSR